MFLGVAMPGDTIGNFGSALQLLGERATYLYAEGDRFWFDLQVSLNSTVAERAQSFSEADVAAEVIGRIRRHPGHPGAFADVVFAPDDSADVAESERVRLVVAGPQHVHDGKSYESKAHAFTRELASTRGNARARTSTPSSCSLPTSRDGPISSSLFASTSPGGACMSRERLSTSRKVRQRRRRTV